MKKKKKKKTTVEIVKYKTIYFSINQAHNIQTKKSFLAKYYKKIEFIVVIGTVQSYLANWGEGLNFSNIIAEIVRKSMREKKVKWCDWEGEKMNFGNDITGIHSTAQARPMKCPMGVPKWFTNCSNQVAKIVGNWRERKYELWQLSCRKWEGKKSGCRNLERN